MRRVCFPLLAVCGLFVIQPTPAPAQEHVFTPQHVAKLRIVTSAVISPDGKQVAYILGVPRNIPKETDGPAWAELHVVDANGTATPFVTGQVNIDNIAWTPDGKAISFITKRAGDPFKALYVIPVRGGESRKVISHGSDVLGYSWASDNKRVAFLAAEPIAKDKKTLREQGFDQEIYEEDVPVVRVWTANVDDGKAEMVKLTGSASELHWSPAGDKLAVALAPTPHVDDSLMFRKVHIADLKTGLATNLNNPGKMGQIAWSPDGKTLAVISGADKHDPMQGRIWIESKHMKGWTDVLPNFAGHVESIAWADARTLVYQASQGCWTTVGTIDDLWASEIDAKVHFKHHERSLPTARAVPVGDVVDPQKGRPVKLRKVLIKTEGPILGNVTSARADSNFRHVRGTSLAFIAQTAKHPPEVYYIGPDDKEPRRLTDSNPWLRTMRFAEQQVIKHRARDGLELEGVLVRPLDEKKGQRYPLILAVHGGPESHIPNGWITRYADPGQVGAARGFAVFYPNYRGSTGRGVAFSMLGQREAAGKEFDDLVDAVDHLVKEGLVDTKKVGITGGSYGGYATAWGSTYYSDRFAAGVMFVGISDSISKFGTTDIPEEMFLVHHRKRLWDDWDYFLKSSPIYHSDKHKTPLLILHGKVDPRVHPSQSLSLHRHLKIRNQAPVRLVLYPGEGHGNRRAATRLDYNIRLMQWMEHYLKGPGGAPPPYEIEYGLGGATKTSALGQGWRELPARLRTQPENESVAASAHWLGGRCPCCIGW